MYHTAITLLVIVILLIPMMLCTKPVLFKLRHGGDHHDQQEIEFHRINQVEEHNENGAAINRGSSEEDSGFVNNVPADKTKNKTLQSIEDTLKTMAGPGEVHIFGEVFIHQLIETIEFVLGTVSNTASYLRLWALSLAHSQLAEVFFSLSLEGAFPKDSMGATIFSCIVMWPAFWSVTFFVLMLMDTLECTLHTLRLHWVEFQNKFYKGNGYPFKPYNFRIILLQVLNRA